MKRNEQNWLDNYNRLKEYIEQHRQLPDKKKVENRGLLNWWKYNRKKMRDGSLDTRRAAMLTALGNMRDVHN